MKTGRAPRALENNSPEELPVEHTVAIADFFVHLFPAARSEIALLSSSPSRPATTPEIYLKETLGLVLIIGPTLFSTTKLFGSRHADLFLVNRGPS